MRRTAALAVPGVLAILISLALPGAARALVALEFQPLNATAGTTVTIVGFPPASDCAVSHVYLSPGVSELTSPTDPRLTEIPGRWGSETIAGTAYPTFTFIVPGLPAGAYQPYFLCGALLLTTGETSFTVLPPDPGSTPPPPGLTPPPTETAIPDAHSGTSSPLAVIGVAVLVWISMILLSRRARRS